ncbi:MAG: FAD-dependent oxidoreductase [Actinomycetota bacterium]
MNASPILVVGGGVSGLTCGVRLLEEGHAVEIWARDLSPNTTSDVAAATWYPLRGERDDRCERWLPDSLERFRALARDARSGVVLRQGIELFRRPMDDAWWRDILPGFRHARPDELPAGFVEGFVSSGIPVIEMPIYLTWLTERFTSLGGRIVVRALLSFDEAFSDHDIVVNCAGLGARELAGDSSMVAIRGQVVRVAQFGLERYILDEQAPDGIAYVYPRSRDVVCGGTREAGNESREPDPETARAILARCAALEPRVATAPIVSQGVGLRPGRPSVRLEAEAPGEGKLLVHDYGHGGSGVTLSWGCADEVAELISSQGAAGRRVDFRVR